MDPSPFPVRISVEVTNRCNQSCRLCPRAGFTRPLGLIDVGLFERIADEVARHDSVLWLHFLGEPLLHPDLSSLIRYAKAAGVRSVGLSTNATLLEGRRLDLLVDSGLDRLDFSLDSADRHGYLAMRGEDHFERATTNVRAFLATRRARGSTRPIVSLQFMRTPELEAELDEVLDTWEPLLGPDDFVKTIVAAPFHDTVSDGDRPKADLERTPCPWLFGSLMVLQDGTVTMCGADWDAQAPLGHLAETSITDLWHGAEATRRRQAHLDGRYADVALCGDCTDWHLADGHGYQNARRGQPDRRGPVAVMIGKG